MPCGVDGLGLVTQVERQYFWSFYQGVEVTSDIKERSQKLARPVHQSATKSSFEPDSHQEIKIRNKKTPRKFQERSQTLWQYSLYDRHIQAESKDPDRRTTSDHAYSEKMVFS